MGPLDVRRFLALPVAAAGAGRVRGDVIRVARNLAHGLSGLGELLERGIARTVEVRKTVVRREGIEVVERRGIVVGVDDGDRLAAAIALNPAAEGDPIGQGAGGVAAEAVGPADLIRRQPGWGRGTVVGGDRQGLRDSGTTRRHRRRSEGKWKADREQGPRFEGFAKQPAVMPRAAGGRALRLIAARLGLCDPLQKTRDSTHDRALSWSGNWLPCRTARSSDRKQKFPNYALRGGERSGFPGPKRLLVASA